MTCPICGDRPHDCPYAPAPRVALDLPSLPLPRWQVASRALAVAVTVTMVVRLAELVLVIHAGHLLNQLVGTTVTAADRGRLLGLARDLRVLSWILSGLGVVWYLGTIAWFIISRRLLTRFGELAEVITGHWTFKGWRVLLLVTLACNLASNTAFSGVAGSAPTGQVVARVVQRSLFFGVVHELILAVVLFAVVRALREVRRLTAPIDAVTAPAAPAGPIAGTPVGPIIATPTGSAVPPGPGPGAAGPGASSQGLAEDHSVT
jgi:hypothetical protein